MTESLPYLKRVLQLNPLIDAEEIIELRRKHLFPQETRLTKNTASVKRDSEAAARAQESIDEIRQRFWALPLNEIRTQLSNLDLTAFPELKITVDRLKYVAALRGEFPKLAEHKYNYPALFGFFKNVVVMSPQNAGLYKESTLRQLQQSGDPKRIRRMIKMMMKSMPDLYRLESDWFDNIYRSTGRGKTATATDTNYVSSQSSGFGIPWWVIVLIILFVIRMVARLAAN